MAMNMVLLHVCMSLSCVLQSSRSPWALESSDNASPVKLKEQVKYAQVDTCMEKKRES